MSAASGSGLNVVSVLKEVCAEKLLQILKSIDGKKDLVIDKEVICSLDFIASFSQLKLCDVEKVFKLEPGACPGVTQKCVYFTRPRIRSIKIIADHINANKSIGTEKSYWIVYVPRKLFTSQMILEREGVFGYIKQMEFPLGFITLDKDLLSLEISDFFKTFYLKGDLIHIHTAAMALVHLCKICGPIPKIFGQGRCAKMVVDLLQEIMEGLDCQSRIPERISHLIILDRDIDYVSVLLSQLTYEGLLDETFGITSGRVTFHKEVTGKDEPMKVALNSNDVVYEGIRNAYFASVFSTLRDKAKELQAKRETSTMSLGAMKEFVTKEIRSVQQQHTSLSLHIGACEVILDKKNAENFQERLQIERDIIENRNMKECVDYIEDVINRQDPYVNALRLMCLLSISQDGLSASDYESLATQFRQSYGYTYLVTLHNLKKIGILDEQAPLLPSSATKSSKIEKVASTKASKIAEKVATAVSFPRYSSFKNITKKFNLIPAESDASDLKNPKNMSYVFGGAYVPLVGKITEQIIMNSSFKNIEDGMKLLPGSTIMNFNTSANQCRTTKDLKSETVVVYVLGGITYAEVAALRLLGQLNGVRILIATTSFISGNSLIKILSPSDS